MQGGSIVALLDGRPVSLDTLVRVKHPYEEVPARFRTKAIQNTLLYMYYWDESAERIYRKSPVAPWLEVFLWEDDFEYLDVLRYNKLRPGSRVQESLGFGTETFLSLCAFLGTR